MSMGPIELEKAVLDLEPGQRAKLAMLLLRSLEEAGEVDEQAVEEAWLAEAEERSKQIDAGEVALVSADSVLADLRRNR